VSVGSKLPGEASVTMGDGAAGSGAKFRAISFPQLTLALALTTSYSSRL
jgi:hypothetical protein